MSGAFGKQEKSEYLMIFPRILESVSYSQKRCSVKLKTVLECLKIAIRDKTGFT